MSSLRSVELQPIAALASTASIRVWEGLLGIGRGETLGGRKGSRLLRGTSDDRNAIGSGGSTSISIRVDTDWAGEAAGRDTRHSTLVTKRCLISLELARSCLTTGGAATSLVALDLGLNAAAVGGGADSGQVWTDGLNETDLHLRIGVIQSSLDNVIGEGVTEETIKLGRLQHLLDQHILGWLLGASEALLDDVGTELLLRELGNPILEHRNQGLGEDRLIQIEDVLNDVVAERILN